MFYYKQIWFFSIRDCSCSVEKLLSLCRLRLITSVNPNFPISARLKVTRCLFSQSHWSERANHFWNWCHLILSQAEIESSTKPGFTESTSLKGFSPLLLLCWSAIIIANHNVNNIKQMSMLKVECDFDSGDCCPNETFSDIWDTYCNDCQCLEWTWLVENSKEHFCLTLYWFTWLRIEIHWILEKII